ncbi:twin transmembrane helix small protein [Cohaesibacter gelatinilyticus]|uniref:Hypoxia induced protein conserved region n=1 Tax=Cohaesibacter gelatinilyticus TaxID=372072 RepID=A0A285PN51_9HYPH|nr:twin transmembrane helix small protein [Cohaesibacter gelatinilyticus]SNZ21556.1 Hypoxia induced protein conserved region [Cohaesibacter gelatinilyticus]HAT84921.1 twin transmembrane helix small protein [Hyphomicrobiales bacterium]
MSAILPSLVPIALIIVAIVLVMGLLNMLKGNNPNRSQQLMRWRVIAQFVAIILIMLTIYVTSGG